MRWQIPLIWLILGTFPSTGKAAFPSCVDAYNYGRNSSRMNVGQSFTRVACDASFLDTLQLAFDRLLSLQVLRTRDSDATKLCFYDGYWDGLITQLRVEYARCEAVAPEFACLSRDGVTLHATNLLRAVSRALRAPADLTADDLRGLFAYDTSGLEVVALCDPLEVAWCTTQMESVMDPATLAIFTPYLDPLANQLCVE